MAEIPGIQRHLEKDYTQPVRDPLWKHIYLTPALERALRSEEFVRLSRLRQLGLAFHVYPGALHSRANHSLGVFHLAKRIISTIAGHPDCPDFLTLAGVKAFLCAALFHDLGHFPYAHVLEDGLNVKHHEVLTGERIRFTALGDLIRREVEADPFVVAAIVDHNLDPTGDLREISFFRRLLSGVLDPDKLDYLNRDAFFCGIPYGHQDTDFIISQIRPHPDYGLVLGSKGMISVEHLLFSKYLMYKSVYWHKGVRTPSGIIKKALGLAIRSQSLDPEILYNLDDSNFSTTLQTLKDPVLNQIPLAEIPGNFLTFHEEPYDEFSLFSLRLQDSESRRAAENDIREKLEHFSGEKLLEEEITIDIPHSVSFEVDLPILKEGRLKPFTEAGTVFERNVVRGFTTTLKKMRLIGPGRLKGKLPNLAGILQ